MNLRCSAAVAGGILLNLAFGGLYAYSAMVPGLEQTGLLTRTDTAMVFALSTTSFMAGVWLCSVLLMRWRTYIVALVAGIGAATGLLLCARVPGLGALVVGYSAMYGACVGVGYGLSLAGLARVPLRRPGAATGVVVAFFAIGSICWAQGFALGISRIGMSATLYISAGVLALLAGVAALALRMAHSTREAPVAMVPHSMDRSSFGDSGGQGVLALGTLWLTFFAVACAGLTVIGQALQLLGGQSHLALLGLSVVGVAGGANGVGRLCGGAFADRLSPIALLGMPLLGTALGLSVLLFHSSAAGSYMAILLIALMYGWCSAAVPAVVMCSAGAQRFSKVYGQIFTAWGLAGLSAPWLAGWVFSVQGSYDAFMAALWILNALVFVMLWCKRGGRKVSIPGHLSR